MIRLNCREFTKCSRGHEGAKADVSGICPATIEQRLQGTTEVKTWEWAFCPG